MMSDNNFVTDSIASYESTNYSKWCRIPEPVLIDVLNYLSARAILNVGQCCRRWNDISKTNYLWKKIFRRDFQSDRKIELKPGKCSTVGCFHMVVSLKASLKQNLVI